MPWVEDNRGFPIWKPCLNCDMLEHCKEYGMQYSCLRELWEEKKNEKENKRD